jgi:hypothetical protein
MACEYELREHLPRFIMRYRRIPDGTVQRLPFHVRGVLQPPGQGVENSSSPHFAEHVGVHPRQTPGYVEVF